MTEGTMAMKDPAEIERLAATYRYDISDLDSALTIITSRGVGHTHALEVLETLLRAADTTKLHLKASELAAFAAELVQEAEIMSESAGR